ncbi:MAG: phage tail tape measure protein, partial [Magnetococcales bacterium]|nr:phage tail tape measure protein [Magnetococcales bacterium]
LSKVRNLLPFSDAREGPLSQLTLSGSKILETLGVGMQQAAPGLQRTAAAAMAGVAAAAFSADDLQASVRPMDPPAIEGGKREKPSGNGSRTEIHIHNLNLPNVKSAQSFTDELQLIIRGHDG